jgi:hypothetical protein
MPLRLTVARQYASLLYPTEASMSMKSRSLVVGFAGLLAAAMAAQAAAQTVQRPRHHAPPPRYVRPYIEIRPQHLLYRRCVDWLELQHRPSGTVLYPQYRCWWVRG